MNAKPGTKLPDLHVTRTFDAPRALVWEVWTNPRHAMLWWGPHGFTNPVYESDLRTGGKLLVHMRAPDGTIYPNAGTYEEVVVPERIVTVGTAEMDGTAIFEVRTTISFEDHGERTTIVVQQEYRAMGPGAEAARVGAQEGWSQMLDRFANHLVVASQAPSA